MIRTGVSMNTTRAPADQEAPFGYFFEIPGVPSQAPYPPSGPPLLDNSETDLLRNFFDNPNNLESSFLSFTADPADEPSSFSNNQFTWIGNGSSHSAAPVAPQLPTLPQTDQSRAHTGVRDTINAPEDVYAAAQVLHNKQPTRQNNMALQYGGYNGGRPGSNGYLYGNVASSSNTPYNFAQPPQHDSSYTRQNLPYGPADDFSPYNQNFAQDTSPYAAPEASMGLKFGSDDNFRRDNYAGPKVEPPDKTLADMGSMGIDYAVSGLVKGLKQQNSASKKRGKVAADNDESEDDQTGDDDGTPPKRRRRGRDDDAEYNESGSRFANGKSRQSVDGKGRIQRISSTKRSSKVTPSAASRQSKENLSEEQKRSNHIQSEQKRRNLIRLGFEDLNLLVPDLRAGGYSKSNMLSETAKFIYRLQNENNALKSQMQDLDPG